MKRRRSQRRPGLSDAPRRPDRKTLQLCRQVADALNYVLTGELDDDVLRNLYVESVRPAPNASRLLVSVAPLDADDPTPADVILHRLVHVSGKLRTEVAESIHRRKTPELAFCVVRPGAEIPPETAGGETASDAGTGAED
jgi:ribosome-binding factor A